MNEKQNPGPADDPGSSAGDEVPREVNLRDGESVRFEIPTEGTPHIVVNVVPPQRSSGFLSSCFQGCGCILIILVVLGIIGSFPR
ncbi:MAG: hypothetical protein ACKOXM_00775 [Agromyces sp.]